MILSPVVQLPLELERLFVVVDHEPPTRNELHELLSGIATEGDEMPIGNVQESVLDVAAGLTRYEAENAFSLSLVRMPQYVRIRYGNLKRSLSKNLGC